MILCKNCFVRYYLKFISKLTLYYPLYFTFLCPVLFFIFLNSDMSPRKSASVDHIRLHFSPRASQGEEGINWSLVRTVGIYYLDLFSARSQGTECISTLKATSLSWQSPDTPTVLDLMTASSPCPFRPKEVRLQPLPDQGTAVFLLVFPFHP